MAKNKRNSIGIMQGRLTPSRGRGIQFFPFDNWHKEFNYAKNIAINEIEFIFDFYKFRNNPLWTKRGRRRIISSVKKTGVKVNNICADYFMRRPFFRLNKKIYISNLAILKKLVKNTSAIGASFIGIPLLDNSSIKNKNEETEFLRSLDKCLDLLEKYKIKIGLEADLAPKRLLKLVNNVKHPLVGINYDTGNSSSLGYNPEEELETYGKHIFNVHIKDRVYKGSTVMLGEGHAKFDLFFKSLKNINYSGPFILQAARGEDGKEKETIKKHISFLSKWF